MVVPGIVGSLMRLYDLTFNGCVWSLRLILFFFLFMIKVFIHLVLELTLWRRKIFS
jgi:hypothetical protein